MAACREVVGASPHVSAQNVLVLTADRETSFRQAKPSMTILDLVDSAGPVQLFTGGTVVDGRWNTRGVNEPFNFTTLDGKPLLLAPGNTWVECLLTGMSVQIAPSSP